MNACHARPRSEAGQSTARFRYMLRECFSPGCAHAWHRKFGQCEWPQSDCNNACATTTVLELPLNIVLRAFNFTG